MENDVLLNFLPILIPMLNDKEDINDYKQNTEIDMLENLNTNNVFSNITNCHYQEPDDIKLKGFSIMTLNIRSLMKHKDELIHFLENFNKQIEILILTETWNNNMLDHKLPGYKAPINAYRSTKKGGGISIYIAEHINANKINNSEIINEHIETVSISIEQKIITAVYRPPAGNKNIFINELQNIIQKHKDKKIYIGGDFNINLCAKLYEPLIDLGLIPACNKFTRIDKNSRSIIDNILTTEKQCKCYIVPCSISDHFPIILEDEQKFKPLSQKLEIRTINHESIEKFKNALLLQNWENITSNNNISTAYKDFEKIIKKQFEENFPLRLIHTKKNKSWITPGIRKSQKIERKLYIKKCAKPTQANIAKHTEYKKILDKTKRKAKNNYIKSQFESAKGDSKKTWETIRQTINKKNKEDLSDSFNIENKVSKDEKEIADHLNLYFNQIGAKLADKTEESKHSPLHYASKATSQHSFKFIKVTKTEVENICSKLKPKKSCGPDGISSKLLKEINKVISKPLTHLINLSLTTGEIPQEIKESIIVPIYKDGDRKEACNHRPISLLNSISKIFEKIVHKQLYEYLDTNAILSKRQYGFQNKSSCEHAMVDLLSNIEINKDENKITNLTFIDLSKAFDTLSHSILLEKLRLYGVQDTEQNWFKNYLQNRTHKTKYKLTISNKLITNTGVPQGSILGPLLFLIYINDLPANIEGTVLYADDTTLINEHSNIDELEKNTNKRLEIASDWFKANKLTLNAKKTRNLTIYPGINIMFPKIKLDGKPIQQVSNKHEEKFFKFLGFRLDNNLSWKHHIQHVTNKLKINNYILASIKNTHPKNIKKLIYQALGQSHIEYGLPIWYNSKTDQIHKIQKKILRNICNTKYNAHTKPLLAENRILTIHDLYTVNSLRLVNKAHRGQTASNIQQIFKKHTSDRPQRKPNNIKPLLNTGRIHYDIPTLWNNLNEDLKTITTKKLIKLTKEKVLTTYSNFNCTTENCKSCRN